MTLPRQVEPDGPESAKIVILTDRPGWADLNAGRLLTDHAGRVLWDSLRSGAGILRSHVRVEGICLESTNGAEWYELGADRLAAWESDCLERLRALSPNLIITLGDWPLRLLTGQSSSDRWHLSIIPQIVADRPKVLSFLHPERVFRSGNESFYLRLGALKAQRFSAYPGLRPVERRALIRPTPQEAITYLESKRDGDWLSVDIETGRGQITCLGIAPHPYEGMCVPTLRENYASDEEWYAVWQAIAYCLSGSAKKVLQNGIYDLTYLSAYGVPVRNFYHDTMAAQRVLYPEFSVGLDNIARIYTDEPYWKDEAKDWSARADIDQLYRYNVKDTTVTLEAAFAQRSDLERRGLQSYFEYVMRLARGPVIEMSWRGLPLDIGEKDRLAKSAEARVAALEETLNRESQNVLQRPTNPRSPKQVKELLAAAGFKRLPFRDGKETSDKGALMKLQLKSPNSPVLKALIEVSEAQKELSSYLRFEHGADNRLRFTLNVAGTESGRFSCYKDPWDRGLNAQTIPGHLRSMVRAPEGRVLIEVDLRQADARVVAWDSADPTLLEFYREGKDIHRYVASQPELFNVATEAVTKDQRQLGKKVGHAANYGVGEATLSESCLKEMGLVISKHRAAQMLSGYYRTFPGIRRWQERIRADISTTRRLDAPTGWHRYFHGRMGHNLFKEAYAWRPQHVVAYTINQLVLWLDGHVDLLLQTHDSVLMEVPTERVDEALARIKAQASWNPTYRFSGGDLQIPIEIKLGQVWSEAKVVFEG